jgi:ribonuclease HI
MDRTVRIFTDSSAIGNPGPGGWGAVLMQGSKRWEMSGGFPRTTISEMELVAAIQPLRSLDAGSRVELRSDSECLIRGMRYLVQRWRQDGWRDRRGALLQHRGHWEELLLLDSRLRIEWRWPEGS